MVKVGQIQSERHIEHLKSEVMLKYMAPITKVAFMSQLSLLTITYKHAVNAGTFKSYRLWQYCSSVCRAPLDLCVDEHDDQTLELNMERVLHASNTWNVVFFNAVAMPLSCPAPEPLHPPGTARPAAKVMVAMSVAKSKGVFAGPS